MTTKDEILQILNEYHRDEYNASSGTVVSLLPYAKKLEVLIADKERAAMVNGARKFKASLIKEMENNADWAVNQNEIESWFDFFVAILTQPKEKK